MPTDDVDNGQLKYCHNDGCSVRSARYESAFSPLKCPECGAYFHDTPPRRDNVRPMRAFDTY